MWRSNQFIGEVDSKVDGDVAKSERILRSSERMDVRERMPRKDDVIAPDDGFETEAAPCRDFENLLVERSRRA